MKTLKTFFAVLLISSPSFLTSDAFAQNIIHEDNQSKEAGKILDPFFTNVISERNMIALGACLMKDGRIIWQNAYGHSDFENRKPNSIDNIYQLASLSKVFTATALMQLYEKGLFRLDDDINRYLPFSARNPYFPDKPITFRMLLTHTAGFADVTQTGNKISLGVRGDPVIKLNEFVEGLFRPGGKYYSEDYFSRNEPGTKYDYSNISFSLLGYILESITKKDFSEYCKENIFRPLEMHNTAWFLRDLDTNKIIFGYGFPAGDTSLTYRKVRHFGLPGYPEGMLRTTMQDLSKFISAFINNGRYKNFTLLQPETVSLMLSPQGIQDIPSRTFRIKDIGITWLINDIDGSEFYSMNGFSGSIFTNAYFSRKDRTAIIYYFTGISMRNMPVVLDITRKMKEALGREL